MKARVLHLDSDQHLAAQVLLPWYANATLDAEEKASFEAHLGECAALPGRRRVPAPPAVPTRRRYPPVRSTAAGSPCAPASTRARRRTARRRSARRAAGRGDGCRSPSACRPCSCCSWARPGSSRRDPAEYRTLGARAERGHRERARRVSRRRDRERDPRGAARRRRAHRRRADRDRRLAAAPSGRGSAGSLARLRAAARGRPGRIARRRAGAMKSADPGAALCGLATTPAPPSRRASRPHRAVDPRSRSWCFCVCPPAHFRADGNYASGYADASGRAARRRIAAALARSHGLALATDWPMPIVGLDCLRDGDSRRRAGPTRSPTQLSREPRVDWAQAMNVFRAAGATTIRCSPCSRPRRAGTSPSCTRAATGRDVRVAVIDSGVQLDHPDLAGRSTTSANFIGDRTDLGRGPRHRGGRHHRRARRQPASASPASRRSARAAGAARLPPAAGRPARPAPPSAWPWRCSAAHRARRAGHQPEPGRPAGSAASRAWSTRRWRAASPSSPPSTARPPGRLSRRAWPASSPSIDEPGLRRRRAPWPRRAATCRRRLPGSRWATVSGASYAAAHVSGLLALMIELQQRSRPERAGRPLPTSWCSADGRVDACASLGRAGARCVCACGATASDGIVARH